MYIRQLMDQRMATVDGEALRRFVVRQRMALALVAAIAVGMFVIRLLDATA
jgi:hypothetical protein